MGAGQVAGIVFYAMAFLINIVAVTTPAWIYDKVQSTSTGLLHGVDRQAAENSALGFSVLADILLLAAIAGAAISHAKKSTGCVGSLGGIFGIIAAMSIMAGMSIFTGLKISGIDYEFFIWGYSFALGWVSFGLALIGGIAASIVL